MTNDFKHGRQKAPLIDLLYNMIVANIQIFGELLSQIYARTLIYGYAHTTYHFHHRQNNLYQSPSSS